MKRQPHIADRLLELVRRHNRDLVGIAALKASLGAVFSLLAFGLVFGMAWFLGLFVARYLSLQPGQFGILVTGLFLAVAVWSAWRRVNPMEGLKPLSDRELMLTLISFATPGVIYFSPRHATAGAALILLGGPANIFQALKTWTGRISADAELIEEAARLLPDCRAQLPAREVEEPAAAVLLRRLALIKVLYPGDAAALTLTDKGLSLLSNSKIRPPKS